MIDLKTIKLVLGEFEDRGITRETMIDAIETAMATAYKKEYGKRGQIVRAKLELDSGTVVFEQIKTIVDESTVRFPTEEDAKDSTEQVANDDSHEDEEEELPRFDAEKHITLKDAKLMKRDAQVGDELVFPLEPQDDFGRIAAQTAKQVIIQKIREAEKVSILDEFANKKDDIVSGIVQRVERGAIYVDLGRTTGLIPYEEQVPGERYRPGERIRAYLYSVDEGFRGVYLRLSRAHPQFVEKLFEMEAPELASGVIETKALAREAGSRTKLAVASVDPHVDPVGSLVGQRGVRVSTVISELGGERIDIVEWSDDPETYIKEALSPATIIEVELNTSEHRAMVTVTEDQQSLAIGRGGQNVRLAAKLTGWNIDIVSTGGDEVAQTDGESVDIAPDEGASDTVAPSGEEGVEPTSSEEVIPEKTKEAETELPAEEELTEKEGESIVDEEESRDKVAEDE
ncbi:MAG TPA: transcription termination/antitermination protein NusA [Candidatus Kaiserbacteria bacterium]|nr:transcription termination/antitermination protein NusA [Candidatus Kaiserbacteria bacterium]